jgi:hypothetical protein
MAQVPSGESDVQLSLNRRLAPSSCTAWKEIPQTHSARHICCAKRERVSMLGL